MIYRVWMAKQGFESTYYMEGNWETMEEMSLLAAKHGVTCNISSVGTRQPKNLIKAFNDDASAFLGIHWRGLDNA